jgi:hypothetical protein
LSAAAYVEALRRNPNSVYKAMLEPLRAKGAAYTLSSLPKAESNTRRLGYLTAAPTKGRAGGQITHLASSTLEEDGFDGFPPAADRIRAEHPEGGTK